MPSSTPIWHPTRRKSHPRRPSGASAGQVVLPCRGPQNGSWRTAKPDTDNLEKALKDEMTRLHFWADDAQVCSEIVEKFWSDPCGVFVRVEEL